jgi:uncharacterized membrane protein
MNIDIFNEKQLDVLWMKLMKLGEKTGCHQRPDRSFFIQGYQLPVCARCTGVILGYLLSIPGFLYFGYCRLAAGFGCIILFVDWLLQALKIKESTNRRRLITGILGGFGLMSLQLKFYSGLIKAFHNQKQK